MPFSSSLLEVDSDPSRLLSDGACLFRLPNDGRLLIRAEPEVLGATLAEVFVRGIYKLVSIISNEDYP